MSHTAHDPAPYQLIHEMPNKYDYLSILRFLVDSSLGGENLPDPQELAEHIQSTPFLWQGPHDDAGRERAVKAILEWASQFDPKVQSFVGYRNHRTVWDGALHTLVHAERVRDTFVLRKSTLWEDPDSVLTALPNLTWQGLRAGYGEGRKRRPIKMARRVEMTLAHLGVYPRESKAGRDAEESGESEEPERPGQPEDSEGAGAPEHADDNNAGTAESADNNNTVAGVGVDAVSQPSEASSTARRRASADRQAEQAELETRAANLQARESDLANRNAAFTQSVADLEAREAELKNREGADNQALAAREADLDAWERELQSQKASLENLRSRLDARAKSLETEATNLKSQARSLENENTNLETRAQLLDTQKNTLDIRSQALDEDKANLSKYEAYVARAQEEAEQEKAEMVPRWLVERIVSGLRDLHHRQMTKYEKDVNEWAQQEFEARAEQQ